MGKESKKEKPVLSNKLILKLKEFVNEGDNPNKIAKTDEFKEYTYHKLNALILEHLRKVWDPKSKKYFKLCTHCNPSTLRGGLFDLLNKDVPTTDFSLDEVLKSCSANVGNSYSESPKKTKSNDSDNSTVLLESISKSLDELNRKIDNIDKFIEENNPIKQNESIEVMSKMLSSDSHKKSINLNKEIEKMILKKMEEKYGIKNNFSKAINTALFLSLYK